MSSITVFNNVDSPSSSFTTTTVTRTEVELGPGWAEDDVYPPLAELRRALLTDAEWAALSSWEKDLWEMKYRPDWERLACIEEILKSTPAEERAQRHTEILAGLRTIGAATSTSAPTASAAGGDGFAAVIPDDDDGAPASVVTSLADYDSNSDTGLSDGIILPVAPGFKLATGAHNEDCKPPTSYSTYCGTVVPSARCPLQTTSSLRQAAVPVIIPELVVSVMLPTSTTTAITTGDLALPAGAFCNRWPCTRPGLKPVPPRPPDPLLFSSGTRSCSRPGVTLSSVSYLTGQIWHWLVPWFLEGDEIRPPAQATSLELLIREPVGCCGTVNFGLHMFNSSTEWDSCTLALMKYFWRALMTVDLVRQGLQTTLENLLLLVLSLITRVELKQFFNCCNSVNSNEQYQFKHNVVYINVNSTVQAFVFELTFCNVGLGNETRTSSLELSIFFVVLGNVISWILNSRTPWKFPLDPFRVDSIMNCVENMCRIIQIVERVSTDAIIWEPARLTAASQAGNLFGNGQILDKLSTETLRSGGIQLLQFEHIAVYVFQGPLFCAIQLMQSLQPKPPWLYSAPASINAIVQGTLKSLKVLMHWQILIIEESSGSRDFTMEFLEVISCDVLLVPSLLLGCRLEVTMYPLISWLAARLGVHKGNNTCKMLTVTVLINTHPSVAIMINSAFEVVAAYGDSSSSRYASTHSSNLVDWCIIEFSISNDCFPQFLISSVHKLYFCVLWDPGDYHGCILLVSDITFIDAPLVQQSNETPLQLLVAQVISYLLTWTHGNAQCNLQSDRMHERPYARHVQTLLLLVHIKTISYMVLHAEHLFFCELFWDIHDMVYVCISLTTSFHKISAAHYELTMVDMMRHEGLQLGISQLQTDENHSWCFLFCHRSGHLLTLIWLEYIMNDLPKQWDPGGFNLYLFSMFQLVQGMVLMGTAYARVIFNLLASQLSDVLKLLGFSLSSVHLLVPWDLGVFRYEAEQNWYRLEGKPVVKEGGMLASLRPQAGCKGGGNVSIPPIRQWI